MGFVGEIRRTLARDPDSAEARRTLEAEIGEDVLQSALAKRPVKGDMTQPTKSRDSPGDDGDDDPVEVEYTQD